MTSCITETPQLLWCLSCRGQVRLSATATSWHSLQSVLRGDHDTDNEHLLRMTWGEGWHGIQQGPGFCLRQCQGRVEQSYSSNAFEQEAQEVVEWHAMNYHSWHRWEKEDPALPMWLQQPASFHILLSNTASYIWSDRTCRWAFSQFFCIYKRKVEYTVRIADNWGDWVYFSSVGLKALNLIANGIITIVNFSKSASRILWKQSHLVLNSLSKPRVIVSLHFCERLKPFKRSAAVKGDSILSSLPCSLYLLVSSPSFLMATQVFGQWIRLGLKLTNRIVGTWGESLPSTGPASLGQNQLWNWAGSIPALLTSSLLDMYYKFSVVQICCW